MYNCEVLICKCLFKLHFCSVFSNVTKSFLEGCAIGGMRNCLCLEELFRKDKPCNACVFFICVYFISILCLDGGDSGTDAGSTHWSCS